MDATTFLLPASSPIMGLLDVLLSTAERRHEAIQRFSVTFLVMALIKVHTSNPPSS